MEKMKYWFTLTESEKRIIDKMRKEQVKKNSKKGKNNVNK